MGGAGDDDELLFAGQELVGCLVHLDDRKVVAADDQERRRGNLIEIGFGQIGPSPSRHDSRDVRRFPRRGLQGCSGSGAGAEITDSQIISQVVNIG